MYRGGWHVSSKITKTKCHEKKSKKKCSTNSNTVKCLKYGMKASIIKFKLHIIHLYMRERWHMECSNISKFIASHNQITSNWHSLSKCRNRWPSLLQRQQRSQMWFLWSKLSQHLCRMSCIIKQWTAAIIILRWAPLPEVCQYDRQIKHPESYPPHPDCGLYCAM